MTAFFPNSVWSGLSLNEERTNRKNYLSPNPDDWAQIVDEVLAIEDTLLDGLWVSSETLDQVVEDLAAGRYTVAGVRSISASTVLTDVNETVLVNANSGNVTVWLPPAVEAKGRCKKIKKIDSSVNTVTVDADGSETIDGQLTKVIAYQWSTMQIISDGSSWVIV